MSTNMDLQVLRTAKAAVDEGLLQPADYDFVKQSFLRAQSLKAALDAGLVSAEDYADARREFFASLAGPGSAPANGTASSGMSTAPAPAPAQPAANGASALPAARAPLPAPAAPPPAPAPVTPVPAPAPAPAPPTPSPSVPTNIADRGGKAAVAHKVSVAGIGVHADSINLIWDMRVKKTYRWATFKIGTAGKTVEIDAVAPPASTWAEFVAAMPSNQCRYGVFDYQYINSEGTSFAKLVFVSWSPDNASVKAKMQYAPTKDLFRGLIDGVSVEQHATDLDELDESIINERVKETVEARRN